MGDSAVGGGTVDLLNQALNSTQLLRANLAGYFETIATGVKEEGVNGLPQEEKEKLYKKLSQKHMQKISDNLRTLEQSLCGINPPTGPFSLGNSALISQEAALDRITLYSQLVDSYKWLEKVNEFSAMAGPILGQNSLRRTYFNASSSSKRRRSLVNSYMVPPESFNNSITAIVKNLPNMEANITRPLGSNAVLNIVLGRTLRAIVILKGWLIEWVVIRGIHEDAMKADNSLDLWSGSQYKVFQKLTDNANAAMLHFCAPTHPELSVRSFLTWLHSHINLFSQACKKCGLHLSNNFPPTWRDLRSLDPYHEECKP